MSFFPSGFSSQYSVPSILDVWGVEVGVAVPVGVAVAVLVGGGVLVGCGVAVGRGVFVGAGVAVGAAVQATKRINAIRMRKNARDIVRLLYNHQMTIVFTSNIF